MNIFGHLLLTVIATVAAEPMEIQVGNALDQFLYGLFSDFLEESKLYEIQMCLKDVSANSKTVEEAIKDLMNGDIDGAVAAIKEVIGDVTNTFVDCEYTSDDFKYLGWWIQKFNTKDKLIATLKKNFKANEEKIEADLKQIVNDIKI